jgi:DNA replication protein DnaC
MKSQELQQCLKELRLPAVRELYETHAETARKENLSYERYLLGLMEKEREIRKHNKIQRYLKQSGLPAGKTLETFDRNRLPPGVNAQLSVILEGYFVERAENILAFGNPGSGKTHLLCAIARELIYQGKRVLFRPSAYLIQEMLSAKKEYRLPKYLKQLSGYDVLYIDDIGYVQQDREEMELLFTLFADRYEKGSIILTSNLPFSGWEKIFKDPMTTAAAIDRLVHHSVILELNLKSFRLEEAQKSNIKHELTNRR